MRPTLTRLLRLSERYQLVETPISEPQILTERTLCPCVYPDDKPIDHAKPLYGTKALSWKHALVHSNVEAPQWASNVELMPSELISKMASLKRKVTDPSYPVVISNIDLARDYDGNVLVFPENRVYSVSENAVGEFMREVLRPDGDVSKVVSVPNRGRVILICGHAQRDIRCGIAAPVLKSEFEDILRQTGLLYSPANPDGVRVGIVSHIGGHVYAGNVIYFDEDGLSIWYGRCEARHVDGIIRETILEKKVIKDLFRGRFA